MYLYCKSDTNLKCSLEPKHWLRTLSAQFPPVYNIYLMPFKYMYDTILI